MSKTYYCLFRGMVSGEKLTKITLIRCTYNERNLNSLYKTECGNLIVLDSNNVYDSKLDYYRSKSKEKFLYYKYTVLYKLLNKIKGLLK